MASDLSFVEFVVEQIEKAGVITYRKMFGEYALYCEGKIVALICDNQLFVKPTEAGRSFIGNVVEAPPYPGAKPTKTPASYSSGSCSNSRPRNRSGSRE